MITVVSADRSREVPSLDARGGFAWWYADALDARGDGVVVIAAFGLPFLPGYAAATRAGRPERMRSRPSLNVAAYRGGRPAFYLLQELDERDAMYDRDVLRFGRSELRFFEDRGAHVLAVSLDAPLPATRARLTGTIHVRGSVRHERGASVLEPTSPHEWSPVLAAAAARVELRADAFELSFEGAGYHDRNVSSVALDRLGIAHWVWGRARLGDDELVYYLLFPEDGAEPKVIAMSVDRDGVARLLERARVALHGPRVARFGMPTWHTLVVRDGPRDVARIEHANLVDDGPFYLRYLTRAARADDDVRGFGFAEMCRPSRVDLGVLRPLVRMRVHALHEKSSMWLPLFSGPNRGRVGRLVRSLWPRRDHGL